MLYICEAQHLHIKLCKKLLLLILSGKGIFIIQSSIQAAWNLTMAPSGKGVLLAEFKLSSPGNGFSVTQLEYILDREIGAWVGKWDIVMEDSLIIQSSSDSTFLQKALHEDLQRV